jgi:hypothetical protein
MDTKVVGQLKELKQLLDKGIITQEEFNVEKAKLMGTYVEPKREDSQTTPIQVQGTNETVAYQGLNMQSPPENEPAKDIIINDIADSSKNKSDDNGGSNPLIIYLLVAVFACCLIYAICNSI